MLGGDRGAAFGEGEADVAEVGVDLVETEAAAPGEGESVVEVVESGGEVACVESDAGEVADGEVALIAIAAEAFDGLLEVGGGLGEVAGGAARDGKEVGAAKGEMVEGDVEKPVVFLAITSVSSAWSKSPIICRIATSGFPNHAHLRR